MPKKPAGRPPEAPPTCLDLAAKREQEQLYHKAIELPSGEPAVAQDEAHERELLAGLAASITALHGMLHRVTECEVACTGSIESEILDRAVISTLGDRLASSPSASQRRRGQ